MNMYNIYHFTLRMVRVLVSTVVWAAKSSMRDCFSTSVEVADVADTEADQSLTTGETIASRSSDDDVELVDVQALEPSQVLLHLAELRNRQATAPSAPATGLCFVGCGYTGLEFWDCSLAEFLDVCKCSIVELSD